MFRNRVKWYIILCFAAIVWCVYLSVSIFNSEDNYNDINMVIKSNSVDHNIQNEELKYILLWTKRKCFECAPFYYMTEGDELFKRRSCPQQNCYVTENRTLLGNYSNFDAVLFNGRPILRMKDADFPKYRSPRQSYVFVQLEAADRFPVCPVGFDDFFNDTMTYRLDSDFPWPYLEVVFRNGTVAGPKTNMTWISFGDMDNVTQEMKDKLSTKTKAAAWFVTNCHTRSGRETFVKNLQSELLKYNLSVDVYGKCGTMKCPRSQFDVCADKLENDYHFYLSFENSFNEDYATEKLLTAIQHRTVPVVFGGANYTRLLPPNSYLNAKELGYKKLAETMAGLMQNRSGYEEMFRWTNHYEYRDAIASAFCALCQSLHRGTAHSYRHFREWWYGAHFKKRCKIK